jgi:hypothetical protein
MPATRRVKCKRNVKQHGGGLGGVVNFTPSSFGHLAQNPLAWSAGSSCMAEPRPGMISSFTPRGLPGFQMGGRRRRNSRRNSRKATRKNRKNRKNSRRNRKQHGGAYGFTGVTGIVGGYPGGASYPPVTSIGCTAPSSVDIPASGSDGILNRVGGPLWDGPPTSGLQRGGSGAAVLTGSPYELGLTEKTAGYSSLVPGAGGVIHTAAGPLLSVNVPSDGRIAGGACGMPPQRGGRRNSRKNRKNSRKNRKNSRRNRKNSRKDRR